MSAKIDNKAHVFFQGTQGEYLRNVANTTGWSVDYVAHFLIGNIKSMEQTIEIELKDDVIPANPEKPNTKPVRFRKKLRMQMKI